MIAWTTDLATGVALLDEHHKTIFQWLAELESAATEDRTLFGVYALTRLNRYMREHFAAEEALMRKAAYPELEAHIAEHTYFRERIGELHVKSIAEDISADTVEFLKDWLIRHIANTDMSYVPYLKQAGLAE